MPSVVVDSVLVEAGWDPSALERGLALSERLVQEFVKIHPSIRVDVDTAALDGLNARIGKQIPPLKVDTTQFTASIDSASAALQDLFAGFTGATAGDIVGLLAAINVELAKTGQTGFLQALVPALEKIKAEFAATSVEAKELQAIIDTLRAPRVVVASTSDIDGAKQALDGVTSSAERTRRSMDRVGTGSVQMGHGVRGAAQSLAILATSSIGVTGPLGRLAQNILLFSGGLGGLAAVAGAVLAIVAVFEAITKHGRDAKKATDDAIESLLKLRDAQRDPIRVRLEETGEAVKRLDEIRTKVVALVAEQQNLLTHPLVFSDRGGDQTAARLTFIQGRLVQLGQEFAKTGQAAAAGGLDIATESAKQLATALQLGTASAADIQQATDALAKLNAEIRAGNLGLKDWAEKQAQANALIEGIQAPAIRGAGLDKRAIDEAVAAVSGVAKAQAQVAAGPGFDALIAKYRALESAAAGDVAQVQRLADTRHDIEQLARSTDNALKAFANIGGLSKAAPILDFKAKLEFVSPIEAIVDAVTGRADARIRANLDKILAELKQRSDAALLRQAGIDLTPGAVVELPQGLNEAEKAVGQLNDRLQLVPGKFRDATNEAARLRQKLLDTRTPVERLNDSIHEVTRGADGILGAAVNVGLIGDEAANSIGSVLSLADALGNLAESASTGNILGAIGAGIGFVGGLFAKDPAAAALEDATRQNSARLEELSAVLKASALGVGGQQKVGQAATALGRFPEITGQINAGALFDPSAIARLVNELLAGPGGVAGVTFADLQKAADTAGITLVKDGQLVGGAFIDLATAVGFSIDAMTHFTSSFADQVSFADLTAKINGGLGDAVDQFQRDLSAAGAVKSTFIADFFKGIDIRGDAAGFQKRLQELLKLFAPDSDFFKNNPTLLGGLTVEDWKKLLNDGADAMELLTDATTKAQKSLGDLNVPQGFRRAAIAFQTGDTGPGVDLAARTAAVANLFPKDIPVIKPLPDDAQALLDRIASKAPPDLLAAVQEITATIQAGRQTTTTGDVNTTTPAAIFGGPKETRTTITFEGGITVNISGEHADPNKMADDFFAALRRKALTQSGDTLQFGVR